jgi:hypothetical protein
MSEGQEAGSAGGAKLPPWMWLVLVLMSGGAGSGLGGVLSTNFLGGQQDPMVVQLQADAVKELSGEMAAIRVEIQSLNRNWNKWEVIMRNNWDRYEQWEFAGELEARLRDAGVQVQVPRPERKKE